ncbi:MAG: hypothetical protein ACE5E9_02750 [Nitrospinaceae bacterium]
MKEPNERMKEYLGKIAAGPRMSKDLTEEEAEDALSLILNGSVSPVRAGIFLIAARMKLETVPENIGYWRALDRTTLKREVAFDRLLQIADPFDGFNRVPYFGFYTIPIIAALGLPAYGHSTLPLPPKCGITFEDLLVNHYGVPSHGEGEQRLVCLLKHGFGYLSTSHTHPALENLRNLRVEIVKRPMLATLEKMLMPVKARRGGNFLATGYFHKGYETAMLAVARLSEFDKTILGNGVEGTTLYGVHKDGRIFIGGGEPEPVEMKWVLDRSFDRGTADLIAGTYRDLKKERVELKSLAEFGEAALKNNRGPAAALIACHAGTLCYLLEMFLSPQDGFDAARKVLSRGTCYTHLMRFLDSSR